MQVIYLVDVFFKDGVSYRETFLSLKEAYSFAQKEYEEKDNVQTCHVYASRESENLTLH